MENSIFFFYPFPIILLFILFIKIKMSVQIKYIIAFFLIYNHHLPIFLWKKVTDTAVQNLLYYAAPCSIACILSTTMALKLVGWWGDMVPRDNPPRDNLPRDNVPQENLPRRKCAPETICPGDYMPRDNVPWRHHAPETIRLGFKIHYRYSTMLG